MGWRVLPLAIVACATALACGSGRAPASPTRPQLSGSESVPNRLAVRAPLMFAGDRAQARATAFIPIEAVDVTTAAQWESSAAEVATVDHSGQVTAHRPVPPS
jgi:hypothetical protein